MWLRTRKLPLVCKGKRRSPDVVIEAATKTQVRDPTIRVRGTESYSGYTCTSLVKYSSARRGRPHA